VAGRDLEVALAVVIIIVEFEKVMKMKSFVRKSALINVIQKLMKKKKLEPLMRLAKKLLQL
jgi:hypothetical protein